MKKRRILTLTFAFLLVLTSCGKAAEPNADTTLAQTESAESTEGTPPLWADAPAEYLRENFPVIDGSTSLIPLEAGVRADIFGISREEATEQVEHSSTWGSFYNLLDGKCDVIFTCPLSEEQRKLAEERGIALECVPVAKEGFIFVVNGENPVEELTQAELKGIYSGQITNWSEVGGPDSPIIAYQRNNESGSQNYMIEFMGDTPLTDAPVELRPTNMAQILDVLSANDNAVNSIGYSVYAYAADMYGDGDDIKFIAVDGVPPTKQTMAAGDYPLMGINYAVFRADEPTDSNVRALVEYMTSYDGQLAAAGAGYITLEDMGYDYTEMTLTKYSGTGTGGGVSAGDTREDYVAYVNMRGYDEYYTDTLNSEERVDFLTDKELQSEVNAFIDGAVKEVGGWRTVTATARNGYLSVTVSCVVSANDIDHYDINRAAVWDLYTGKRLTMEELFADGTDVDDLLNAYVRQMSMTGYEWGYSQVGYFEMKRDFAALPLEGWCVSADAIYIDKDNPYFPFGVTFPLSGIAADSLVSNEPRAMDGFFEDGVVVMKRKVAPPVTYYEMVGEVNVQLLNESAFPAAQAVNGQVKKHIEDHFQPKSICEYFGIGEEALSEGGWRVSLVQERYAVFRPGLDDGSYTGDYPHERGLVFDLTTGERLRWQDILREGWQNAAMCEDRPWYTEGFNEEEWEMIRMAAEGDELYIILQRRYDCPDAIISGYTFCIPLEYLIIN